MRVFLKNKFPRLKDDSFAIQIWYPAYRRLLSYNLYLCVGIRPKRGNDNATRRYLTRIPNPAGIGDQISSCWVETYSIAKKLKLQFVHQPFVVSYHSPTVDWEDFLGFGVDEVHMCDLARGGEFAKIRTVFIPPFRHDCQRGLQAFEKLVCEVYAGERILFHLGTGVYLNNESERDFSPYEILRSKYFRANPISFWDGLHGIRIAVHVRRGDLDDLRSTNPKEYSRRWLDISYYQLLINAVLDELDGVPFSINIFSDGTGDELGPLTAELPCVVHLGGNPKLAFHQMVTADILLPGLSSFSIVAGKLSRGAKLMGKQFDDVKPSALIPQTRDWIRVEESGALSSRARSELNDFISERWCQLRKAIL